MNLKSVLAWATAGPGPAVAILIALFPASIIVLAGTTTVAAHPSPAMTAPARKATPTPHIFDDFARDLRGPRWKLPKGPSHVNVAWNVDGCDHAYGSANQCVPWNIPGPAGSRCHWLAAHGFGPLKVRGRDRLNLDTNQDGVACGKGDAGT
jgi:hypothetical protein